MSEIKKNIEAVRQKVLKACERAGRRPEEVHLIAVSKTVPPSAVSEAMEAGVFTFGENRVQELLKKQEELSSERIDWHLIGHLQVNKAKYLPRKVSLIHSVDSLKLAKELQRVGKKADFIFEILVQVNVASEESKFGLATSEVSDFMREIAVFPNIKVRGLMTVPPILSDSNDNRLFFRELRKIMVDLNKKNIDNINMDILSMGMTSDYETAIEEGANFVRVGTGIFGERQ